MVLARSRSRERKSGTIAGAGATKGGSISQAVTDNIKQYQSNEETYEAEQSASFFY